MQPFRKADDYARFLAPIGFVIEHSCSSAISVHLLFVSVLFGTLSVHFKCSILRRHLLMKVCIFFSVFCVVRHVSAPGYKCPLLIILPKNVIFIASCLPEGDSDDCHHFRS